MLTTQTSLAQNVIVIGSWFPIGPAWAFSILGGLLLLLVIAWVAEATCRYSKRHEARRKSTKMPLVEAHSRRTTLQKNLDATMSIGHRQRFAGRQPGE